MIRPKLIEFIKKIVDNKLDKTGNSELIIERNSQGNTYCHIMRSDTNQWIGFGIGNGGQNRGIYDFANSKWMFHSDQNNKVYVDGLAFKDTLNDIIICRSVNATFASTTSTNVSVTASVPAGYKFLCWLTPVSNGWVSKGMYCASVNSATTHVWTDNEVKGNRGIICYYLCIRDIN